MRDQSVASLDEGFAVWLDRVATAGASSGARAFVFNLYEGETSFDVQLDGCSALDLSTDWVGLRVFSSGEDLFEIPRTLAGDDWRAGLTAAQQLIRRYRSARTNARCLDGTPVACGFVDGDYELVPDA
jgi:hypothetical protein